LCTGLLTFVFYSPMLEIAGFAPFHPVPGSAWMIVGSAAPLASGARAVGMRGVETRAPPEQTHRMVRLLAARAGSRGR
jgi:hypothetical protein